MICYKLAKAEELAALTELALTLWPGHSPKEMGQELARLLEDPAGAVWMAWDAGQAVGFAQCQLRRDYVEGTASSPVGYLEGIFVAESHRGRGIARMLLAACENWARQQGCAEFASDCELTNRESLQFHLQVGFTEANRIICFTKKL